MGEHIGEPVEQTVLFTDIEGSTRLWDEYPARAAAVLEQHDALLSDCIAANDGDVVGHTGDGMIGRFHDATAAARAAIGIQRALRDADWGDVGEVKVRIGIHTGEVVERPDGLFGWALNHCSRVMDVGHGGQVLLSDTAARALDLATLGGAALVDLGDYGLRDVPGRTRLRQLVADDLPSIFPPLRKTVSSGPPIPRDRGRMFGRDDDLAALLDAMASRPLVTLTGAPGVGKSRLVVEAARRAATDDGRTQVLWCELAGIESDAAVSAIMTAQSISLRPGQSPVESLVGWLSEHRSVLVLDGCDASVAAVARLAEAVGERAPDTKVVVTSQVLVGVRDETILRLAPLDRAPATELFMDRSVAAGARDVSGAVAGEIADLLDGMPYAIEIAAANAAVFSPTAVRDALLTSGLAGVGAGDDRFTAVQDAVGLAVGALEPDARRCLLAATVFTRAFDVRGFRVVCDPDAGTALPATLAGLVDSSLLQPVDSDGHAMFTMLDPVRSAIGAGVDASVVDEAERRLRDHVVALVEDVAAGMRGSSEQLWLRVLDRHFGEIRSVFFRAVDTGDTGTAATIASVLWEWAFFHFNSEYWDWGRTLLERADTPDSALLAKVHGVVALGSWFGDDLGSTRRHADEAIRREHDLGAPFSLPARLALINSSVFSGADAPPPDVFAESDEYHRSSPEGFYRMNAEAQNAIMATWLGRDEAAEHLALKALRIGRRSGNPTSIAYAEWVLGQAIERDDPVRAEQLFDESLRRARDVDNRWVMTNVQVSLASLRRRTSGPLAAVGLLADLLHELRRAGHWPQLWNVTRLVALCAADLGDDELAYELAVAVEAAEMKFPALPVDARDLDQAIAAISAARGDAWTRRASGMASTWTPDDVAAIGLSALASMAEQV